jgi:hypothetical protein
MFFSSPTSAQQTDDSVKVSLLTCSPGQEVYTLYGHTAIRYHDLRSGLDITFNYGMFSFKQPNFIMRFALGKTDYELGIAPFPIFCEEYANEGRGITEQILNLTKEEKLKLFEALKKNYEPENRTYRYNFFYDNCTTRARDMIMNCISGKVNVPHNEINTTSYRDLTHEYNSDHPWARFGNDMLLGLTADAATDYAQRQFLPVNLMNDFNHTTITSTDGTTRPLVSDISIAVQPGVQVIHKEFPLSPTQCSLVLLIIVIGVTIYEKAKHKTAYYFDFVIMAVRGITGCLILFMFFSEHPTTSTNLLILLLNPIPIFFIPRMLRLSRHHVKDKYFLWSIIPIGIYFLALVAHIQEFPTAMSIVALSLLIRDISRFRPIKQDIKNEK